MREVYKKYYKVSDNEKISDRVMFTRIGVSAVLIVLYVIAMSVSAYAYFYHGVASQNNIIKSAEFKVNVTATADTVQSGTSSAAAEEVAVEAVTVDGKLPYYKASLTAGKKYTITVKLSNTSTASTGFCVVKFYDPANGSQLGQAYHTQQLGVDRMKNLSEPTKEISFTIIPNRDVTATFLAHWGTSSYYEAYKNADFYIEDKESVTVPTVTVNNQGGNQLGEASEIVVDDPTPDPSTEPDVPTVEPSEEPVEPSEEPIEPSEEPIEPSEEPIEPSEEPIEPSEEPIEPSEEPIEPSEEPVEPSEEPVEPSEEPVEPVVHIVGRGQTLSSISRLYGVSVDRIIAYNGITDPDMIITGSKILIPPADWQMPAEA